jgi:hypothetical protein
MRLKMLKIEEMTKSQSGDRCLVCGADPAIIGIFVPEEPVKWGAAGGKTRLIRYCLCNKCQGWQDTPENVEKIIRAELDEGGIANAS